MATKPQIDGQWPLVSNTQQWEAFQKAFDAPPRRLPRLHRLLLEPSAIELGKLTSITQQQT